jgi:L-amino acid N-acyltransferase YncA
MKIRVLESDQMMRIGEMDRTETIESEYVPLPSEDGLSLTLTIRIFDPPKVFPDWDANGVECRARWWKREVDEGGLFIVAEENDKVAGFAVLGPTRNENHAEMLSLFVGKKHRSKGLGGALLTALESKAKERGVRVLTIQANHTVRTVEFHRRMGYRMKCLIDNAAARFPESETGIILVKELAQDNSSAKKGKQCQP